MSTDLHRSALFLGLVLLFSLPFLLLPGELPGDLPLPASAAIAVVPLLAALAAARITDGRTGVIRTIARATSWHVWRGWWWPVLAGVMPVVLLASASVVLAFRDTTGGWDAEWITGQVAFTVMLRVVIQELAHASGGGVMAAAVVQAGSNTAWFALPPTLYVPAAAALVTAAAAATIVVRRRVYRTASAFTGRTEKG